MFEFFYQTVVSLFNSLSQFKDIRNYTYIRFLMKNLIRSKEKQIRKQEPKIARKTHEIASLEGTRVVLLTETHIF